MEGLFCSRCGNSIPTGANFCPACGMQVSRAQATIGETDAIPSTTRWRSLLLSLLLSLLVTGIFTLVFGWPIFILGAFLPLFSLRHQSRK